MNKSKYPARIEWAKKWTKHNTAALRLESQGNIFDAETKRLMASISKDFSICHGLLDITLHKIIYGK